MITADSAVANPGASILILIVVWNQVVDQILARVGGYDHPGRALICVSDGDRSVRNDRATWVCYQTVDGAKDGLGQRASGSQSQKDAQQQERYCAQRNILFTLGNV